MMKDVFTNALQKLAAIENAGHVATEPAHPEPAVVQSENAQSQPKEIGSSPIVPTTASIDLNPTAVVSAVEMSVISGQTPSEPTPVASPKVSETAEVAAGDSTADPDLVSDPISSATPPSTIWQRFTLRITANRRQTAAAIVLACMGYMWFEDSSTVPADNWSGETDIDFADVDSMASAFDSAAGQPTREPAEPQGEESAEYKLMIPDESTANSSGFGGSFPSSSAVAVYPDEAGVSGNSLDGNFSIPNTTQPSAGQNGPGGSKRVRFTGGIQRAN